MPDTITANQLVAYNLMRARKALGLSQAEAAARIAPYLGAEWSTTVYSAAERSYVGRRVRQFSADEITAFALAFDVHAGYFWVAPPPGDRNGANGLTAGERTVPWRDAFWLAAGTKGPLLGPRLHELPPEDVPDIVIPEPVMGRAEIEATARQVLEDLVAQGALGDLIEGSIASQLAALVPLSERHERFAENLRSQAQAPQDQEGASPQ